MRSNADLDAAFAELVRAADAAFPTTCEPAIDRRSPLFGRRRLTVTALAVAVVAVSVALSLYAWSGSAPRPAAVPTVASPTVGFTGHWVSTDVVDGSAQTFIVSGSGTSDTLATRLHDTVATLACAGGPADVQGPGRVSGGDMFVTFTVSCPGGGRPPVQGRTGAAVYSYHSSTDTLTDESGNVWHRA